MDGCVCMRKREYVYGSVRVCGLVLVKTIITKEIRAKLEFEFELHSNKFHSTGLNLRHKLCFLLAKTSSTLLFETEKYNRNTPYFLSTERKAVDIV